jgi:hypothetical protein
LPAFGVGDRKDSGGAVRDSLAHDTIEQPLCGAASLQTWRRSVGGQQIRNTSGPQVARSNGAGQISAGVQMCDIECRSMPSQVIRKPHRQEALTVVGQSVR